MRRIVHISDLHFGTELPEVAEALLRDIARQPAHLLVVSGDLTQRARGGQFAAAKAYLARIDLPQLIVPGNHDIPLYNVVARFGWSLANYRRYITTKMCPKFTDDELAIAGVNTARPNRWKDGCISKEQIEELWNYFREQPETKFKVLVAHHPFIPPVNDPTEPLVEGAKAALRMLEMSGCHLILAGHLHLAYTGDVRPHHVEVKRSILVAQAGTAISHRQRDEPNAYNVVALEGGTLQIEVRAYNGCEFSATAVKQFVRSELGWVAVQPTAVGAGAAALAEDGKYPPVEEDRRRHADRRQD
jgi:3',5'-cyclic AMP phosphodiesterase CpdA